MVFGQWSWRTFPTSMILGFWDYHRLQGIETLQEQFQISSWYYPGSSGNSHLLKSASSEAQRQGQTQSKCSGELHKGRSDASSAGLGSPHGKGGDEGIADLVGVAPGVVAPEEINHSVHTHGAAARHGGGNVSLCLALLPAKPGWKISPAPTEPGWVCLEGFNDSSSQLFPPFQMEQFTKLLCYDGKGSLVNTQSFWG